MFGVLLGCFTCLIPRTAQGNHYWPQFVHSLYLTYSKTLFVFAIFFIILPSLLCARDFFPSQIMLGTKFFNFIAKISFWTYLIHLTVVIQFFMTRIMERYYEFWSIYPIFASMAFSSMTIGFVFVLLVEIPFSKLQKKLMHSIVAKRA